jgi:hypothetical protein
MPKKSVETSMEQCTWEHGHDKEHKHGHGNGNGHEYRHEYGPQLWTMTMSMSMSVPVSFTVFPAPRITPFWLKKGEYCSAESKMLHMRHICTFRFFAINAPQVKHICLTWNLLNFLESNGSCPRCRQYSVVRVYVHTCAHAHVTFSSCSCSGLNFAKLISKDMDCMAYQELLYNVTSSAS